MKVKVTGTKEYHYFIFHFFLFLFLSFSLLHRNHDYGNHWTSRCQLLKSDVQVQPCMHGGFFIFLISYFLLCGWQHTKRYQKKILHAVCSPCCYSEKLLTYCSIKLMVFPGKWHTIRISYASLYGHANF